VLNAAYLVSDHRADAFRAAAADLRDEHPSVQLTLTGPWPAYSFVAAASEGGNGR
jgi:Gas vesicle synthesis protein GvpL/GvpF